MRESQLLAHVYAQNATLGPEVLIPPGDDMAGVCIGERALLIAVDQVADGVHVDCARTDLRWVGRKAMTRNLSDVAAMAARPVSAVVAACLPDAMSEPDVRRLFDAVHDTGRAYGCPVVGGDIAVWEGRLLLSVTLLAEPAGVEPVRRSGARPGDLVCVTGELGGAWAPAGEEGGGEQVAPHLRFEPRLEEARALATTPGLTLHSLIDLSDGLAADLRHICEASGVAAELEAARLPLREEARRLAGRDGRPGWLHALSDGEDYELCFTVDAEQAARALPQRVGRVSITPVGRIIDRSEGPGEGLIWLKEGRRARRPLVEAGWEHGVGRG